MAASQQKIARGSREKSLAQPATGLDDHVALALAQRLVIALALAEARATLLVADGQRAVEVLQRALTRVAAHRVGDPLEDVHCLVSTFRDGAPSRTHALELSQ